LISFNNIKPFTTRCSIIIGNNFKVKRFIRWEMGEGLEKRNEDFAAEVAAQTKNK